MSAPYPVLQNGMTTSQGIWDVVTDPVVPVGMRAALPDGRVYYYARQSAAGAIVAGNVLQRELTSVDWDDLAVDTHLAGETIINATPVGSKTYEANELAEGFVCVNSGTGIGMTYKISGHGATTAATAAALTLYDPIAISFAAATTVTVIKNSWMDPIVAATAGASLAVGVANVGVAAGDSAANYFWCQTWGMCAVTAGATTGAGDAVMVDTTTAGETLIATAGNQVIGVNIFASVNADACPTFLQIAP